jgi:nucleoside-diphosphate-sugar epimerase
MTRALVAGGAGFIGRNLVKRLLDGGVEVAILDDLSSPSPLGPPEGATFYKGSVVDPPPLDGRFDFVYHLASPASPPRYLANPIGTLRAGAEGTRQMLDRAAGDGAVFLLASTSEIYGDPAEHPQPESYFGNVDVTSPRSCYDEAKRYAEALTYAYQRSGELAEVRVARIFNTYGPAMAPDDGRIITNLLTQALDGEPLTLYGDGSQTRSFCYVDDLVDGLVLLAQSTVNGPLNLGSPSEMTVADFADVVAELLGNTGRVYKDLPVSDPKRRQPDISLARSALGWEPTVPLVDGLQRTIAYLRDLRS